MAGDIVLEKDKEKKKIERLQHRLATQTKKKYDKIKLEYPVDDWIFEIEDIIQFEKPSDDKIQEFDKQVVVYQDILDVLDNFVDAIDALKKKVSENALIEIARKTSLELNKILKDVTFISEEQREDLIYYFYDVFEALNFESVGYFIDTELKC